jgi:hypothetical protein
MKIIVIGAATFGASSPATMLHIVAQRWQKQMARLFELYRPELHYMRGPGPKGARSMVCPNADSDSAAFVAGLAATRPNLPFAVHR